MPNLYFTKPSARTPLTRVRAADPNSIQDAVDAAFDKLPTETDFKQDKVTYGTDVGVQNAYVVTLPYTIAAYAEGLGVVVRTAITNSGAVSINVNGLGVKAIKLPGGADVTSGMIPAGTYLNLRYDNANGYFVLTNNLQVTGTVNLTDANASAFSAYAAAVLLGGM